MFRISSTSLPPEEASAPSSPGENATIQRKKRRPAGTPDPDAEVVSLSPRTLLESDRYVCEICNQGFQRDQNLQMHRRRHKVPWKLMKKKESSPSGAAAAAAVRKRVFVCPEPSCLHHDPCHALGDLVGIKKHFRRKHSAHRQWACCRCSKAYAVHSDYKAHLKTCGTRGHSCDCGRVFSRVESFIQHQDSCNASRARPEPHTPQQPPSASRIASSPSTSNDTNPVAPQPPLHHSNIELQLLPPSSRINPTNADDDANAASPDPTELHLSVAPPPRPGLRCSSDDVRAAAIEKAAADEARGKARQQVQMAEQELSAARRIRQQAQAELEKACALRAASASQINSIFLQITCADCRQRLLPKPGPPVSGDISRACSGEYP